MEITVIQPKLKDKQRLRAAAYCRVSREGEEQENSIENQKLHYKTLIEKNPDYDFAGIYYDYGISGYKEQRPGFQKMLADARAGRFDLITKYMETMIATGAMDEEIREAEAEGAALRFSGRGV